MVRCTTYCTRVSIMDLGTISIMVLRTMLKYELIKSSEGGVSGVQPHSLGRRDILMTSTS